MIGFRFDQIFWVLLSISCQSNTERVIAEKKDWVKSIYASSKAQSVSQYTHYVEVSGRLLRYYVREGDTINAVDLMAKLLSSTLKQVPQCS